MNSYFSRTRLLVHPLKPNPTVPRINSQMYLDYESSIAGEAGKLSSLLRSMNDDSFNHSPDKSADMSNAAIGSSFTLPQVSSDPNLLHQTSVRSEVTTSGIMTFHTNAKKI